MAHIRVYRKTTWKIKLIYLYFTPQLHILFGLCHKGEAVAFHAPSPRPTEILSVSTGFTVSTTSSHGRLGNHRCPKAQCRSLCPKKQPQPTDTMATSNGNADGFLKMWQLSSAYCEAVGLLCLYWQDWGAQVQLGPNCRSTVELEAEIHH